MRSRYSPTSSEVNTIAATSVKSVLLISTNSLFVEKYCSTFGLYAIFKFGIMNSFYLFFDVKLPCVINFNNAIDLFRIKQPSLDFYNKN